MSGTTIARGGYLLWDQLLSEIISGKIEVRLGEACRELERVFARDGITDKVFPARVSRRLRALGFTKIGMTGSGYDREPLYRLRARGATS